VLVDSSHTPPFADALRTFQSFVFELRNLCLELAVFFDDEFGLLPQGLRLLD